MYIDCHCHRPDSSSGIVTVISYPVTELKSPGITGRWPASAGIHPWLTVCGMNFVQELELVRQVAASGRIVAIGECGLDRLRGASPSRQQEIFVSQLELAEELCLPVIIHCVRCWSELLHVRKSFPQQRWMIHGCNARPAVAAALLDAGCYLSFGAAILHSDSLFKTLAATPGDRLMLETDDSGEHIKKVYDVAAAVRRVSTGELARTLQENFTVFFGKDADEYV